MMIRLAAQCGTTSVVKDLLLTLEFSDASRAVAGPGTSDETAVTATLCQPSPCEANRARALSKSLGRGTAQRSRGPLWA
jgi:hypothetical protein